MKVLVVTNPFAGHSMGGVISDPAAVKEILAGEHAASVVAADYDGAAEHDAETETPHAEE